MQRENTIPLTLANDNNRLNCFGFIQIHLAPPKESVKAEDFQRVFYVKDGDNELYVKLVDFARVKFSDIGSVLTIPASGFESHVWKQMWLQRYPQTTNDTELAVYCYQRLK